MSVCKTEAAVVTQFLHKLDGGSEPVVVRASDGKTYVAKYSNNLQGPNVLFNESMGAELYRAFGLFTPAWKPLVVTDDFLDANPAAWMETDDGFLRPEAGLCIGFEFLGNRAGMMRDDVPCAAIHRVANRMSFWLAWLLDVCANHVDIRQAMFEECETGRFTAYFIDHGHMFGGPDGRHRLPRCSSHYTDPRMYPELSRNDVQQLLRMFRFVDAQQTWALVHRIPDSWKTPSAVQNFSQCLDALSNPIQLRAVLDELIEWVQRCTGREFAGLRPALVAPPRPAFGSTHFGQVGFAQ